MKMLLNKLYRDEDGAVTVDFVVLTAGVVLMGLVAGSAIFAGGEDLGTRTGETLGGCSIDTIAVSVDC